MSIKRAKQIVSSEVFQEWTAQIAENFLRDHKDAPIAVVGIHTRGVMLAQRIAAVLKKKTKRAVAVGSLDITLYRDDVGEIANQPQLKETDIPFSIDDCSILLVDDVLYTGRTIRAALDALLELGRPHVVRLAVWVTRDGRELPIQADYFGQKMTADSLDKIQLKVKEIDGEDGVFLVRRTDKKLHRPMA